MSAISPAADRAMPPAALRTMARLMPTARRPGPERTRSAIRTFAARYTKAIKRLPTKSAVSRSSRVE